MRNGESSPGSTVLLVDGERSTREFLSSAGVGRIDEIDREQAATCLRREGFDLVVFQEQEGGPAAAEFCRVLREEPGVVVPPVLCIVRRLDGEVAAELAAAGAAEYLAMDAVPAELAPRLGALLARNSSKADGARLQNAALDILSAIPALLLVADAEGRVRFANQALLDFLGAGLDQLRGGTLDRVLFEHLVDAEVSVDVVRRCLAAREARVLPPVRFRNGAGDERVVDLRLAPFQVSEEPLCLIAMHDIVAEWRIRDTVLGQELKLEDIVNGMGASLAILDRDLNVLWANSAFLDWFGQHWGKRFDHVREGIDGPAGADPDGVFTKGQHVSREYAHFTEGGGKRYYRNLVFPVRDAQGALRELVVVTQDVTDVTLQKEQHVLLQELATLLQSTLEIDRLLHIILTCVTAGHALGFNRAFIFLVDDEAKVLCGETGVGPSSQEEAFQIWAELADSKKTLPELAAAYGKECLDEQPLARMVRGLCYPLEGEGAEDEILARTVIENRVQLVGNAWVDARVTASFRERFGSREFVAVPLQAKGRRVGVLLADNLFSGRSITAESLNILELFAAAAGLAVDNARTYAELKLSLERLQEAQEALIHSERLATIGRMAAHVAHEIRNPLVTIGGFARSILKRPDDSGGVLHSAGIVCEEVQRLEEILSGVMDFTRQARHEPAVQDLDEVLRRAAGTIEPELSEHGIDLALDLDAGISLPFDEKRLRQVLLNLVRNAVESFSAPEWEGRRKRLWIRSRRSRKSVRVEIADTGPGIQSDLLPRLFEPFVSAKTGGTGLGLAVVRKIMLDHGGDVSVKSAQGRGATFVLTFPLEPVSPPHLDVLDDEDARVAEEGNAP